MSPRRNELQQGSIVWDTVADARGFTKRNPRPVVIITATEEIFLDQPIVGVAVTTRFHDPPSREEVLLPWDRQGHPATGLRHPSAAVCNWLVPVRRSELGQIEGYAPKRVLLEIIKRVAELNR